jgi:hypothetical protein
MSYTLPSHSTGFASTSTAPHKSTPASYHPNPRPLPLPPLIRVDTQAIKQELHDALGEDGLAYWKAVNGYLVGQLSRKELEGMMKGWLKADKCEYSLGSSARALGRTRPLRMTPTSHQA